MKKNTATELDCFLTENKGTEDWNNTFASRKEKNSNLQ